MQLTASQIDRFRKDGFLVLPNLFSAEEIAVLRAALPVVYAEDTPANIREKRSGKVRTSMGLHLRHDAFARLVRHPRLIEPAIQILGDDRLYVQQVKVNTKPAFDGEIWQWHYDFATHHNGDGVPAPLALNLHVFLDDVTEFNGPLWFIKGSHRDDPVAAVFDAETTSYAFWVVDNDSVTRLVEKGGIASATGPAGTALIFVDGIVHCSPSNMSPWNRQIFSLIVNPVSNAPTRRRRPDYQHHHDLAPIVPLADDCLVAHAKSPVEAVG